MKKIIILSALILTGCGSRKVELNKQTEKEQIKTEVKEVVKTDIDTKVLDTSKIETNEFEVVPIDTTKETVFTDNNGKTFKVKNGVLRHRNKKVNNYIDKSVKVAKNENKEVKQASNRVVEVKQKEVKRDSSFYLLFVFGFIIGLAFLFWFFIWRKRNN